MSELPEIPISPRCRACLAYLEALHARGFWPFARTLCFWGYLPLAFLAIAALAGWIQFHNTSLNMHYIAVGAAGVLLLFCASAWPIWRSTPWLIGLVRRNPMFTPRQWEAFCISVAGAILILTPWLYLGIPDPGQTAVGDTALTIAIHAWVVGFVAIGWGWLRWIWANKQDPFWNRRSWLERISAWIVYPLYFMLAALMALVLAWHLMHQLGELGRL